MKRPVTLLGIVAASILTSQAQPSSQGPTNKVFIPTYEKHSVMHDVGMTPDQRAQFHAALTRFASFSRENWGTNALPREVRQQRFKNAYLELDRDIQRILTPAQYEQFKKDSASLANPKAQAVREAFIERQATNDLHAVTPSSVPQQ